VSDPEEMPSEAVKTAAALRLKVVAEGFPSKAASGTGGARDKQSTLCCMIASWIK
jgi:hypothetical protein